MSSTTANVPSDHHHGTMVSSGNGDLILSAKSYLKIVMHALRYPHSTVNGVLIMERRPKSTNKNYSNRIVDAIPLFHSGHGLTPMVEVALTQVSEYYGKNSNLIIGGYYQVNEHFHEFPNPIPTLFAERIADKIWEINSDSVLFMISNYDLATAVDDSEKLDQPFYMFNYTDGKWKLRNNSSNSRNFQLESSLKTFKLLNELILEKKYHLNLIDFDLHLENVKLDWRNSKLNEVIDQFSE